MKDVEACVMGEILVRNMGKLGEKIAWQLSWDVAKCMYPIGRGSHDRRDQI